MIDRTIEILSRLISEPTVSAEPNLGLVDYATDLLEKAGFRTTHVADDIGTRANVFASIGPEQDGGVVLAGHTDVVPVEGQEWTMEPFRASVDGQRVWGRGSCDMKGFIAVVLAMSPAFADARLRVPLHIALTADEEVGCTGAKMMLEALNHTGPKPAIAIIGEPTELEVVGAHKGCFEYTTTIQGIERHASMAAAGAGAIHAATRFLTVLDGLADELERMAPSDSPFEPPATTINVGRIVGGVARNITAGSATFDWEVRPVQASDVGFVLERIDRYVSEALLPSMLLEFDGSSVSTETVGEVGAFTRDPSSPAVALARRVTGAASDQAVSFGTEAGVYQAWGISAAVCGPGSIEQAHRPDEFIAIDQLEACLEMLQRLLVEVQE